MVLFSHHICLKVRDIAVSRTFYENALGFREVFSCCHTPEIKSCFMEEGGGTLWLQLLQQPDYVPEHMAYGHLGIRTDEIGEAFALHSKMGCASSEIVEQEHQFGYFIKDPDGYETEIVQLKCPGSGQASGGEISPAN